MPPRRSSSPPPVARPTQFPPRQLPQIRDSVAATWRNTLAFWLHHSNDPVRTPWVGGRPMTIPQYVDRIVGALETAELFYVTSDMTQVAVAAARQLPGYRLHPDDMPAETGLLLWQDPIHQLVGDEGQGQIRIIGTLWFPATAPSGADGVQLLTLHDQHYQADTATVLSAEDTTVLRRMGPIGYHDEDLMPWSYYLAAERDGELALAGQMRNLAICGVLATWLLCGQPLAQAEALPAKPRDRRAARAAGRPEPSVRLVDIHHTAAPRGAGGEREPAAERAYRRRWIVTGHWRNQWYPSRQDHRPVWISEHLKGPEGAPITGAERVNVLRASR